MSNVLITGETGTGKELFAWAIHKNSPRTNKNFVVVDCTAFPETLVESMLFGHEKGSFTGAVEARDGLIKQAGGGTLFLDEVGELPLCIQKKFLRVLQDHRFRPIGSQKEIESNFRLIAATNRDLVAMTQSESFREDLLFRLKSFHLDLPPLRERTQDIKELAMYHIAKLCEDYGKEIKGFSPEFFETLVAYDWPGNVRELINTMQNTLDLAIDAPILFPKHLPTHLRIQVARASVNNNSSAREDIREGMASSQRLSKLKDFHQTVEKQYLQDLISLARANIKEAIQISGMSKSRLYGLFKKHNLSLPK